MNKREENAIPTFRHIN